MRQDVELSVSGDVMTATLSRPDKLNAFNDGLVEGLHGAVDEAKQQNVRALVFRGSGKGFSGGFDLSNIGDSSDGDLLLRFVRVEELLQAVYHAPFATISLVHGPCYGAAADLVAVCHWRIATSDARFRMPGSRFGLVLGTHRLANIVGPSTAQALLLREKPFGADAALEAGFITAVSEEDEWENSLEACLSDTRALSPETFTALTSRMKYDTRSEDLTALVKSVTSSSIKSRILSFLEDMKTNGR